MTIATSIRIPVAREAVFAFLAEIENHEALARDSVELISLERRSGGTDAAVVRLRGPLAVQRTADTTVLALRAPAWIAGRASIGRRTRAWITWQIEAGEPGSTVSLSVLVERVALRDRVILVLGGRRWLRRRFESALSSLSEQLAAAPAC
jgi:hypothetical protein